MYFMQEAGEPLKLNFEKHTYGPYSENLRHVLRPVEGHLISGYEDGGDAPGKATQPGPRRGLRMRGLTLTGTRIQRSDWIGVTQLVDGFRKHPSDSNCYPRCTGFASEKTRLVPTLKLITYTYAWGPRKRQFTERQIRLALKVLDDNGWLPGVRR